MISEHGLITTVAWKLGDADAVYALEGSVAMAGALVQWLRDNLGLIDDAPEVEQLARSVPDSGGVVFVPAFSGLFAPYWRDDARGVIVGLTRFANKGHIARAALEADGVSDLRPGRGDARRHRAGRARRAAGRRRHDEERAADAVPGRRPRLARGRRPRSPRSPPRAPRMRPAWRPGSGPGLDELRANYTITHRWQPAIGGDERARGVAAWRQGVDRTLNLVEPDPITTGS